MDDILQQQVDAVIQGYGVEAQWWAVVPGPCKASRDRLKRFIELEAPACIIESEIALLHRKIRMMQQHRLNALN